ncbi:uncharacterized protein LOC110093731 [Dendrobium catenatum]|uniref:uncharacterized protein LOC110093731 n=1 Tax=Dendrobium catenatum TaxID=906689 RepID=UPI00109FC4D0|nr:uncharacterized protein LOC110093731 [Dendrobium catenatum]
MQKSCWLRRFGASHAVGEGRGTRKNEGFLFFPSFVSYKLPFLSAWPLRASHTKPADYSKPVPVRRFGGRTAGSRGLLTASDVVVRIPGQCRYPDSPTVFLGLASAIAVVIAQATISIIAGCICCKRNANTSDTNWTVALISFVASWITFIIAFLLLLTGVALNDLKSVDQNNFDDYCYIVKPGVFSGGAIFSLASVSLGILYYLALQPSKTSESMCLPQNQGITFGKPQIPLQSTQPAFVHEDTYTRQQIP